MAKPKIKRKENGVAHGEVPMVSIDYNNIPTALARLYFYHDRRAALAYTGDRLHQPDTLSHCAGHT